MNDNFSQFENILNPAVLKQNLIFVSLFIALYENFKSTIIDNVKYFYWSGFHDGVEEFKKYEKEVLGVVTSKKNRQIQATLLWLKRHGAITDNDIKDFKAITNMRNILAHDMTNKLFEGLPEKAYELYISMLDMFAKITKWWIKEIELPTNPDISPEQYDSISWGEVTSVNLEFIKIMAEVALTDTPKYYDIFFAAKQGKNGTNKGNENG